MNYLMKAVVMMLATSSVFAHHGWGGYTDEVMLKAKVKQVRFGNPHDRLIVTDRQGNDWNMLLAPRDRNKKFGFGPDVVSVGDEVMLYGQKHKSKAEIKTHCIYKDGEVIYTYYYDSGKTSLQRQRIGEDC